MKILNFGSLNLDKVYKVAHFVREGETISAQEQNQFLGGKGLNQSVALARAGIFVEHAGAVGRRHDVSARSGNGERACRDPVLCGTELYHRVRWGKPDDPAAGCGRFFKGLRPR